MVGGAGGEGQVQDTAAGAGGRVRGPGKGSPAPGTSLGWGREAWALGGDSTPSPSNCPSARFSLLRVGFQGGLRALLEPMLAELPLKAGLLPPGLGRTWPRRTCVGSDLLAARREQGL